MAITKTIVLGSSKAVVGKVGQGLMGMTWKDVPTPDEQAFASLKAGVDSMPAGAKMFINSGEFYGNPNKTANLELLARFFEQNPSYADKAFLSVKGAMNLENLHAEPTEEGMRRSIDNTNAILRGTKRVDLFEPARLTPNVEIEDVMHALVKLQKEGKFDFIGLSEISAPTLRRAVAIGPVAAIEIEINPWNYDQKIKEAIATAKEVGVAVVAYAPLGNGFLSGSFTKQSDLPEGDPRRHYDRFSDENMAHNFALVEAFKKLAEKRNVTTAQFVIAWVGSLGEHILPNAGSSKASRTLENGAAGDIQLTAQEVAEIAKIMDSHQVQGGRYTERMNHGLMS